jgi:hypothetical protein
VIVRVMICVMLAAVFASCIVRNLTGPRLTGTCDGACSHYVECKPSHTTQDGARCRSECPDVFSDRDSLMAYESLSCPDAIEYIDGNPSHTATSAAR